MDFLKIKKTRVSKIIKSPLCLHKIGTIARNSSMIRPTMILYYTTPLMLELILDTICILFFYLFLFCIWLFSFGPGTHSHNSQALFYFIIQIELNEIYTNANNIITLKWRQASTLFWIAIKHHQQISCRFLLIFQRIIVVYVPTTQ